MDELEHQLRRYAAAAEEVVPPTPELAGRVRHGRRWLAVAAAVALLGAPLSVWLAGSEEGVDVTPAGPDPTEHAPDAGTCPDHRGEPPQLDEVQLALPFVSAGDGELAPDRVELTFGSERNGGGILLLIAEVPQVDERGEPIELTMCDPFRPGGSPVPVSAWDWDPRHGSDASTVHSHGIVVDLGEWRIRLTAEPGVSTSTLLEVAAGIRWPTPTGSERSWPVRSFVLDVPDGLIADQPEPRTLPVEVFDVGSGPIPLHQSTPGPDAEGEVIGILLEQSFTSEVGVLTVTAQPADTVPFGLLEAKFDDPSASTTLDPTRSVKPPDVDGTMSADWLDGATYAHFFARGVPPEEFQRAVDSFRLVN